MGVHFRMMCCVVADGGGGSSSKQRVGRGGVVCKSNSNIL